MRPSIRTVLPWARYTWAMRPWGGRSLVYGRLGNYGLGNLGLRDDYPGVRLLLPIGHVLFL
jgi:hypothetical protein